MLNTNNTNNIKFNIDTIHIKAYTSDIAIIQSFIKHNNLISFYKSNKNNKYGKTVVKNKNNVILFSFYKQSSIFSSFQDYVMIEIHGLKKYNEQDKIKKANLLKLLIHLKSNNISYDIQKLDYAIDIKNKNIDNVLIIKQSKRNKLNDISNTNKTDLILKPFILESTEKYNTNRNSKCIIYDKKYKEKMKNELLRIEINLYPNTFRQIRKLDKPELTLQEIAKNIEKYSILTFEDKQDRNKIAEFQTSTDNKNNARVNIKRELLLNTIKHEIIKYDYKDIEDLLCYF